MSESYVTLGQICDKGSSNIAQKDLAEREGKYPIYGAAGFIKNVDFAHQKRPYIAVVKDGAGIGRVMKLPAYSSVIGTMQYIFPKENVDIDYLFYALQYMNLGKYFSGSTIPHIYFRDYQKGRLKLPAMKVQQHQAETLSRIDALFSCRQKQIALLDEIVKSQFVEMIGDAEINPCNWPVVPLANVISKANNGMARRGNDTDGEIVLRLIELQDGYIDYTTPNRIILNDMEKRRYLLKDKDFLFARVNGNPKNVGRCAVFHDIGEPVYHNDHIIRVRFDDDSLDGIFASVLLNSAYGKRQIRGQIKTSAGQYTISQDGIGAILAIMPPLALQTRFAAFVAQVDKSKVEIQKAIDQLEILKKSLMQQYFG